MNSREAAFRVLVNFEKSNNRLEEITNELFKSHNFSSKEKKSIYNLVFGVIRHLSLIDWKVGLLFKGNYKHTLNKFKVVLRLAIYEIDFLDFVPSFATVNEYVNLAKSKLEKRNVAVVNGILRTYLREKGRYKPEKKFKFKKTQLSVKYSFPEWMIEKFMNVVDETGVEDLCAALNNRPDFDIRINTNKIQITDFKKLIEDNQISYEISEYFPLTIKITDVQKIIELNLFKEGYCSIQDESALLISELLDIKEGDRILDACAAPGGKFTAILAKDIEYVNLVGTEINQKRLNIIQQNCNRLNYDNYYLIQSDITFPPFKQKFDKILVDAPCSGLGTIQKNPDIKWRRTQNEIQDFQKLQMDILSSVSKHVKQNGIIIYSTCTINREENEDVVEGFLENNNNFSIIPPDKSFKKFIKNENFLRTFPHIHKMDGSFATILKRN